MTDTTKQIEQERAAFEAWLGRPMMNPQNPSHYNGRDVRTAWGAWLAARATPVSAEPILAPNDPMLKWAVRELMNSLPDRRDWFNPDAEKVLREALAAPAKPQSDLHSAIVNLPCKPPAADPESLDDGETYAYQIGHRDARHAAAELVAAAHSEPVGVVDEGDDGLFIELIYGPNGNPLKRGDKVYAASVGAQVAGEPVFQYRVGDGMWCDCDKAFFDVALSKYGDETRTLYTAPVASKEAVPAPQDQIAAAIHYPACWDAAAYPTLESALSEMYGFFKCSECAPVPAPATVPDVLSVLDPWPCAAPATVDRDRDSVSEKIEEIRSLLDEAYRFRTTSPAAQANINSASELLNEIESALKGTAAPAAQVAVSDHKIYAVIDSMGWSLDDKEKDDMYRLCCAAIALAAPAAVPQGVEAQKGQQ